MWGMRFLFIFITVLMSVSVHIADANTIIVETNTDTNGNVSTSTIHIITPNITTQSLGERIKELFLEMGVDTTLDDISVELEEISQGVQDIIATDPIDLIKLAEFAKELSYLSLRISAYTALRQLEELRKVYNLNNIDAWYFDIVFEN